MQDIDRLEVRDGAGNMIPMSTLLTINSTVGPQTIFRYNNYPSAKITGSSAPGYSSGQAIEAMESLQERVLPAGMDREWTGVTFQQLEAGNPMFIFGMALVFVFLFLAAQYESWSTPLAVLLNVPFALLGAVLLTMVREFDNNVYTQIGFVMLIGLSSKNAILIVEFAKQGVESGKSVVEAALEGARLRYRAILMTAFSFILGVLPLVFASGGRCKQPSVPGDGGVRRNGPGDLRRDLHDPAALRIRGKVPGAGHSQRWQFRWWGLLGSRMRKLPRIRTLTPRSRLNQSRTIPFARLTTPEGLVVTATMVASSPSADPAVRVQVR